MSGGRKKRKGNARGRQPVPPLQINGWKLYAWGLFRDRWDGLVSEVEELRRRDPAGYKHHPRTRFLALLRKIVMEDIPRDPGDARYSQGTTLGSDFTHWRRAKFGGRFRLFFRYHSGARIVAYVWLNDENTLRKAGSRSDVYPAFKSMLENELPPSDWAELMEACEAWAGQGSQLPDPGDSD